MFACDYRQAEAVSLAQAQTLLHSGVAAAWQMLGQAQVIFAQRVAVDGEGRYDRVRFNLAEVSAELGQAEAAQTPCEAARKVDHAVITAQVTLAVMRLMQGQAAEA